MGSIRQSFAWWSFVRNGVEPAQIVSAAARIGYSGVDLVGEQYWPLVRDHGMTIAAVGGHASLTNGLNRRENHDRIAAEIEESVAKAAANGIPNLIVFSGNRAGTDDSAGAEITAEVLRRVAPSAEQAGVTLLLELLNSAVDHPDYQADRTSWGVDVCRMVESPSVRLLYDIYHMQVMEGNVIARIREHSARIGHYHTAGVPVRRDLDEDQELNYPAIVRAIRDTGFSGFLAHEFLPKGDPVDALARAFALCDV